MEDQNSILVIGEIKAEGLSNSCREALRIGRQLADDMQKSLSLCLLAGETTEQATQGYSFGADKVYAGVDPKLVPYTADAYCQVILPLVERTKPAVILMGHNDMGMDLAPRLAFQMQTGCAMDCEGIDGNSNRQGIIFIKPVFGGKAVGHIQFTDRLPHVVTIREGAAKPIDAQPDKTGEVEIIPVNIEPSSIRVRFMEKKSDENLALANRLTSSNIVVAAGRGLKSQEGVDVAAKTAEKLNGAIAGSRPVVDSGWLPYSLQIGLTGKKVHPTVYIAAGISGAIQHMAGCIKSGTLVAINTDESAPIFSMSHYGIIGDGKAVLEGFISELEK